MQVVDHQDWRYPADRSLLEALLNDDSVKQRLQSPAYTVARQSNRSRLLASAVLVEPELLPNLAKAIGRIQSEFPALARIESFVFSSPEINAFITEGRNCTFVAISSAAVNHLESDELSYVLGHEFGHAVFGHLELAAGHLVDDQTMPIAATTTIRSWQRSAEISADRMGLVLAGSLAAAARALFKVASGIVAPNAFSSPEKFAAQWNRLVDEVIRDGERDFQHVSHPFPPLRMKAMQLFWDAWASSPPHLTLQNANAAVARMLSMMDPATGRAAIDDPMLSAYFFWGGLYIVLGAEEILPAELDRLSQVTPADESLSSLIQVHRADPQGCLKRFEQSFRARHKKFTALELHRVICGLLDIASSGGAIQPYERLRVHDLAATMGVSERACDLILDQYHKDKSHER